MMGRSGPHSVVYESGAINRAMSMSGYSSNGSMDPYNIPVEPWVLDEYPLDYELPMSWDNQRLAKINDLSIQSLGYRVQAPFQARSENDYICNNLSYVLIHGTRNPTTKLVAGQIVVETEGLNHTQVGFLHLPAVDLKHPQLDDYRQGIFEWAKIVMQTVKHTLAP